MSELFQAPIQSYAELQTYMDQIITLYQTDLSGAPHGAFWDVFSYEQFIIGFVPGVSPQVKILEIGNGAGSNIVQALLGKGLFGPGGSFNQMPADGSGPWTPEQIQPLIDWIDAKCPNTGS
jgi:hypothetical protein